VPGTSPAPVPGTSLAYRGHPYGAWHFRTHHRPAHNTDLPSTPSQIASQGPGTWHPDCPLVQAGL